MNLPQTCTGPVGAMAYTDHYNNCIFSHLCIDFSVLIQPKQFHKNVLYIFFRALVDNATILRIISLFWIHRASTAQAVASVIFSKLHFILVPMHKTIFRVHLKFTFRFFPLLNFYSYLHPRTPQPLVKFRECVSDKESKRKWQRKVEEKK